jgi:hypothetical protein
MSLSPWDLSGNISFDFSLYRPRRPSYLYATQIQRRRNESYRHATKSDSNSGESAQDFIEGMVRKKRKDSYKQATQLEEIELGTVELVNHVGSSLEVGAPEVHQSGPPSDPSNRNVTIVPIRGHPCEGPSEERHADEASEAVFTHSTQDAVEIAHSQWKYRKNLVVLSISFILVFSAFRSIQNLQSSLNTAGRLGVIAMGCVHFTMFLTCLFAPILINKLTCKWTIVLGLLFYLFWIAANFYPHFYTLIPTSIGVGFGQSLAWGAQVSYIQKLAVDYAHISREVTQQELYKFNGMNQHTLLFIL